MTYELRETAAGCAEIVQTHSIGFFDDLAMAEKVLKLLEADALENAMAPRDLDAEPIETPTSAAPTPDAPISPPKIALQASTPKPTKPSAAPPVVVTPPRKTPAPRLVDRPQKSATAPEPDKPEIDLTPAFDRIRAGEKITDIAPDFGMTMPLLRSKWATYQRRHRGAEEAAPLVEGQERCGCGRVFVPSFERSDQCARCANA